MSIPVKKRLNIKGVKFTLYHRCIEMLNLYVRKVQVYGPQCADLLKEYSCRLSKMYGSCLLT